MRCPSQNAIKMVVIYAPKLQKNSIKVPLKCHKSSSTPVPYLKNSNLGCYHNNNLQLCIGALKPIKKCN